MNEQSSGGISYKQVGADYFAKRVLWLILSPEEEFATSKGEKGHA